LRSFHLIQELSRRQRVTVVTTHGVGDDPRALAEQLPDCERLISLPHALPTRATGRFVWALARSWLSRYPAELWKCRVPALRAELEALLGGGRRAVDLCIADFLAATPNVPLAGEVPVVLFAHNVEHLIWKRLALHERQPWRRALLALEWRKMRACEARACRQAQLTIAVSDEDCRLLAALAPDVTVRAISTGVDLAYFRPPLAHVPDHSLVFTGSLDWYPNEDAMISFIDKVLPIVRVSVPDTTLTIVGRNPSRRLRAVAAASAGVHVTGTVEDVRPFVARSAVYVVPLRIGSGTRLKIFEALAMARPVVSTTIGAEGLALIPDVHYLQADQPAEFARAVVTLLHDPLRRDSLGRAGRQLVASRYSWAHVAREFEQACESAIGAPPALRRIAS